MERRTNMETIQNKRKYIPNNAETYRPREGIINGNKWPLDPV